MSTYIIFYYASSYNQKPYAMNALLIALRIKLSIYSPYSQY